MVVVETTMVITDILTRTTTVTTTTKTTTTTTTTTPILVTCLHKTEMVIEDKYIRHTNSHYIKSPVDYKSIYQ